jgi:hypothetical protein
MTADGLRDARGVPFDVVADAGYLVIAGTGQPLRLGMAEREAPGRGPCAAMVPVPPPWPDGLPVLRPCPEDGVAWHEGRCPCGHDRKAWLCDRHGKIAVLSGCKACLQDRERPHDCPLAATRAEAPHDR